MNDKIDSVFIHELHYKEVAHTLPPGPAVELSPNGTLANGFNARVGENIPGKNQVFPSTVLPFRQSSDVILRVHNAMTITERNLVSWLRLWTVSHPDSHELMGGIYLPCQCNRRYSLAFSGSYSVVYFLHVVGWWGKL